MKQPQDNAGDSSSDEDIDEMLGFNTEDAL